MLAILNYSKNKKPSEKKNWVTEQGFTGNAEPLWRESKGVQPFFMKQKRGKHHGVKDQPSPAPCKKAGSWADDPHRWDTGQALGL